MGKKWVFFKSFKIRRVVRVLCDIKEKNNCTRLKDECNLGVFEKVTSACMFFPNFTRNPTIT